MVPQTNNVLKDYDLFILLLFLQLAAKASRQLQDPLVIMTGNLPQWLQQIAFAWLIFLFFKIYLVKYLI